MQKAIIQNIVSLFDKDPHLSFTAQQVFMLCDDDSLTSLRVFRKLLKQMVGYGYLREIRKGKTAIRYALPESLPPYKFAQQRADNSAQSIQALQQILDSLSATAQDLQQKIQSAHEAIAALKSHGQSKLDLTLVQAAQIDFGRILQIAVDGRTYSCYLKKYNYGSNEHGSAFFMFNLHNNHVLFELAGFDYCKQRTAFAASATGLKAEDFDGDWPSHSQDYTAATAQKLMEALLTELVRQGKTVAISLL